MRGHRATYEDLAIEMASANLLDLQFDEAVIDEDSSARPDVPGQVLIGHGDFLDR